MEFVLTAEQHLWLQHHLPKGFALQEKRTNKREKKDSLTRLGHVTANSNSNLQNSINANLNLSQNMVSADNASRFSNFG